ncbi:hypothetical protein SETIT_4G183000v2 [Setaria italica]|uniref:Reverse transcriptase zinc-binding domain-containing protein n=1 Tax=Setaria italica TaxID=4555 RepID=A0A368QXF7_SETIT|nr:hypothetical protein SETIT_4G183000v2 [Setaria italica]
MYGLERLKKGIIQRIGNGRSIQIWPDNWIPREVSLKVVTKCTRPRIRWVSNLFENEHRDWYRSLRSIFLPVDGDAILKIRITSNETSDQIAWHFEKLGLFLVRSAYKLALRLQCLDQMASSTIQNQRGGRGYGEISGRQMYHQSCVCLHGDLHQMLLHQILIRR